MATEVIPRKPRQLPLDVWIMVVSHLAADEPFYVIYAWLILRRVCRGLKRATELAFLDSANLHNTAINFDGDVWAEAHGSSVAAAMKFVFDRPSENGNRIIFKFAGTEENTVIQHTFCGTVYEPKDEAKCTFDEYMTVWKSKMQPYINPALKEALRPHWTVSFSNIAINDAKLEGMEMDLEAMEVSILWKPVLTKLFVEELHFSNCLERVISWQSFSRNDTPEDFALGYARGRRQNLPRPTIEYTYLGVEGVDPRSFVKRSRKGNMWFHLRE